jgi:transcriptional regulator with XRE-family HTH domain
MADDTFGQRLKDLRVKAGLTQDELAKRAGMHSRGVAKLEQGQREPAWATVQALAEALGVNCTAFEGTARETQQVREPRPLGRPRVRPTPKKPAKRRKK